MKEIENLKNHFSRKLRTHHFSTLSFIIAVRFFLILSFFLSFSFFRFVSFRFFFLHFAHPVDDIHIFSGPFS